MPQDKFRKETFSLALYLMKTKREFRSSHFIHFTLSYLFLFSTAFPCDEYPPLPGREEEGRST